MTNDDMTPFRLDPAGPGLGTTVVVELPTLAALDDS